MRLPPARTGAVAILLVAPAAFFLIRGNDAAAAWYAGVLICLEGTSFFLVRSLRRHFPWLITPQDENPPISERGLDAFMPHGFDPELGWVRKPNTQKEEKGMEGATKYAIDERGCRADPGHEQLPVRLSVYGDSFAFARQVNDDQTWTWHLAEHTRTHVLNFAVGNYGLDQALLRLKREYLQNPTPVVLMGVVPSTIVRILSMWKHYNEFGNTFAFKPSFRLKDGQLELLPNRITSREHFLRLPEHIDHYRAQDYFYYRFFRREMLQFPYLASILSNPARNLQLISLILWSRFFEGQETKNRRVYPLPMKIIMQRNLALRRELFMSDAYAVDLFVALVQEYVRYAEQQRFTPVFLWLPQKDDIASIKKRRNYYEQFLERIGSLLPVLDMTDTLLTAPNLDDLYSDDDQYGGHYSPAGNVLLAECVEAFLKKRSLL